MQSNGRFWFAAHRYSVPESISTGQICEIPSGCDSFAIQSVYTMIDLVQSSGQTIQHFSQNPYLDVPEI